MREVKQMSWLAVGLSVLSALTAVGEHELTLEMMDTSNLTCGWGKARVNRAAAGGPMRVFGSDDSYWVGFGTHAPSRVVIPLGTGALKVKTACAVDARGEHGTVEFKVWADDRLVASSGVLRRKDGMRRLEADLTGAKTCTLEVTDGGDGKDYDHADWINTAIVYEDGSYPPNDVRDNSRQLGILTPRAAATPRVNGASVFGVRPGHPVVYRVPVTGEAPLKVRVEGLDGTGVTFDPVTRALSGAIAKAGDYRLRIVAENAKGRAERDFTIRVGETIALTPAMGWNSWNCFASEVTAEKIRAAADAMVASGLADHGWQYVIIDDFWENNAVKGKADATLAGPARNPDGTIATNGRFPDMKGLADFVHAKGLKIGLYSSPGPTTCGRCTGSWQHEAQDAKSYAGWGYDYLKYDWCSYGEVAMGKGLARAMYPYLVMGRELRAQNRDIVFSLCQYGMENVSVWGAQVGGQSWRTTGDVFDTWKSISGAIEKQKPLWYYTRPGAWNDPDMLCVGKMTWNDFAGSRLAPNEQYTHLSLWALVAAPLMIGCDLTKLDDFTYSLLSNDEVIEIDQDPLGKGAACIVDNPAGEYEIWARPLADGSVAVGLYNKSVREQTIVFDLEKAGLLCKWRVRDVWRQEDVGVFLGRYESSVPGHATELLRLSPLPCGHFRAGMTDIRENAWMAEISAAQTR